MKLRYLLPLLLLALPARADVLYPNLGAAGGVSGTDILACYQGTEPVLGCTVTQLDTFVNANLPVATSSVLGVVKPDGTIITDSAGAITVSVASSSVLGVIKGDGATLTISGPGVASCTTGTTSQLGCLKPDGTIITDTAGVITVPEATSSVFGVIKGDGSTLPITAGVMACATSTASQLGCAEPDNATLQATAGVYSIKSVPLTDLAAQAANTVVMNNTAGSAAPTAVTITNAAKALVGQTLNTANVIPAGTTSTAALVMMGIAHTGSYSITPATTGRILFQANGNLSNSTTGDGCKANIRYGTNTSPSNGDAQTGTLVPGSGTATLTNDIAGSAGVPYSLIGVALLSAGTTYWVDVALAAVTGGQCNTSVSMGAYEF